MAIFREHQEIRDTIVRLQEILRAAILADDMAEVRKLSGDAHGLAENLKVAMQRVPERNHLVHAADNAVHMAILSAQKVGLGTDVADSRPWLLDFKTNIDYADAYLTAALGLEEE